MLFRQEKGNELIKTLFKKFNDFLDVCRVDSDRRTQEKSIQGLITSISRYSNLLLNEKVKIKKILKEVEEGHNHCVHLSKELFTQYDLLRKLKHDNPARIISDNDSGLRAIAEIRNNHDDLKKLTTELLKEQ